MNLFFVVFCLIFLLPNSMSKLIHRLLNTGHIYQSKIEDILIAVEYLLGFVVAVIVVV